MTLEEAGEDRASWPAAHAYSCYPQVEPRASQASDGLAGPRSPRRYVGQAAHHPTLDERIPGLGTTAIVRPPCQIVPRSTHEVVPVCTCVCGRKTTS